MKLIDYYTDGLKKMKKYKMTCEYCNHIWIVEQYYKPKDPKCESCGDKHVSYKTIEQSNVFGYSEEDLEQFEKQLNIKQKDDIFDDMY